MYSRMCKDQEASSVVRTIPLRATLNSRLFFRGTKWSYAASFVPHSQYFMSYRLDNIVTRSLNRSRETIAVAMSVKWSLSIDEECVPRVRLKPIRIAKLKDKSLIKI